MNEAPRPFVLLLHEQADGRHWDLMLDLGDRLATWQLLDDPARLAATGSSGPARRIADHRRAYLTYEGPVSGDRGHVTRVDHGHYDLLDQSDNAWRVRLNGDILHGEFRLSAGSEPATIERIGPQDRL